MSNQDKRDYPKAYRYRRIVEAKRYIDAHFREPIDLEQISDEAHFSKFHFLRLFKKAYGKTPHQYCTDLRMKKARFLLKEDQKTISEICLTVGFESLGSFSTLFKQQVGESPSAFRTRQRKKVQNPRRAVPGCFMEAFF